MKSYQKEIQTKILQYGSLKEIIKKFGVIAIIDFAISDVLNLISTRFYRPDWVHYGLSDAIFHSKDIDRWSRYAHIEKILEIKEERFSILDVGSGGEGISGFLIPKRSDLDFFLFDVRKDAFKDLKRAHCVVGDGCRLPFRDKAFDIIVSTDAIEHIPKSLRQNFYKEMKRVARKKIILTCPMQSSDGEFQGKKIRHYFSINSRKKIWP